MSQTVIEEIDVSTIREHLRQQDEIAFIDVREAGEFGRGHAFLAANLPLSELETKVIRVIPRRNVVVVVQDQEGGDRARRAIRRLQQLGYRNVFLARGGVDGWQQAGHLLFQGVNVPSKAFSEWIEHQAHTPTLSAEQIYRWQQQGKAFLLLDGRTLQEFRQHHIPGAIHCPNAELVDWLLSQQLPDDLPIVITCAGRTRGIIGAQSLIDAGIRQPVAALAGGTQAWRIAGLPLNQKSHVEAFTHSPAISPLFSNEIPITDARQLALWRNDPSISTFIFDVRSEHEYQQGSLPGAAWIAGGQLIQTLDEHVATRGAQIVLFDPTGSRGRVTAWWLYQLGWKVSLYQDDNLSLNEPARQASLDQLFPGVTVLSARQALTRLTHKVQLLSADRSQHYLKHHIVGAGWINRAELPQQAQYLDPDQPVWIFAAEASLAWAIAWDLQQDFGINAQVILGGIAEWQQAGWSLTEGELSDEQRIDFLFWLHDRHSGNLQASRDYLAWEAGLPAAIEREALHGFRRLSPLHHPLKAEVTVHE